MANPNRNTQALKPARGATGDRIRTANAIAQVEEHLRNAAHAGTANPHKVNPFDFVLHG